MVTDPSAVSFPDTLATVDSDVSSTLEAAPKLDDHERRRQRRARFFVPNSSIRLLTVKEAAAELGVAVIWFWQHRHDPDVPKPLRLGDASNPKSPLRYREAELLRYVDLKQRETDALRLGNQGGAAK